MPASSFPPVALRDVSLTEIVLQYGHNFKALRIDKGSQHGVVRSGI